MDKRIKVINTYRGKSGSLLEDIMKLENVYESARHAEKWKPFPRDRGKGGFSSSGRRKPQRGISAGRPSQTVYGDGFFFINRILQEIL